MESQSNHYYLEALESSRKTMALKKAEKLNRAVMEGSIETVRQLLEEGVDVNVKLDFGWTCLLSAVQGNHEEIVHLLLDQGANPLVKKENGATPFIIAGTTGNVSLLKLFLSKGSQVNECDVNGFTAFMEAAQYGKEDALRYLYTQGANVNLKRVVDEEKMRIQKGGKTALMDAAKFSTLSIVELLMDEMQADVNICDNLNRNALVHVLSNTDWTPDKEKIALFLLDRGADVNKRHEDGKTTLILAVEKQSQDLVKAILEKEEVDIDANDRKGKTALKVAVEKKNHEIASMLCEREAGVGDLMEIANKSYDTRMAELLRRFKGKCSLSQSQMQWTPTSRQWGADLKILHGMDHRMTGKLKVLHTVPPKFRIKETSGGGVYLGLYDGKEVAVKIFCADAEKAKEEKTCLEKCCTSNHLVKFYGCEEEKNCLYLCLSLCEKNLEKYLGEAEDTVLKSKDIIEIIFKALDELHTFGFGHQDLHPSNILIDVAGKVFLADFDQSREFGDGGQIEHLIAKDLQALKKLVLYVAMKGKDNFEELPTQCPNSVEDYSEIEDLIARLCSSDKRIPITSLLGQLLHHPYFWTKQMKYRFLRDVGHESDIKTRNTKHCNNTSEILKALNRVEDPFKGWKEKVGQVVMDNMAGPFQGKKNMNTNKCRYEDCVTDLLKFIRDLGEHLPEKKEEVKQIIGDPAEFFLSHFPALTIYVYRNLQNIGYDKHFPKGNTVSRGLSTQGRL